jgi:ParB family chromosome partitioning protein
MATMTTKKLGRGLSALIADDYGDSAINITDGEGKSGLKELALNVIRSGKFQPRSRFDDEYIKELAASIGKNGIMQPIIVRSVSEKSGTKYEIIAGERRWRAAKLAGEVTIPVIIKEVDDQQALELALIENIQRQDLTPLEEATGYQRLMDEFKYTQEVLSKVIGKSRSHIANLLRLLNLPQEVKDFLENGSLTMGHARALMNAEKPIEIAKTVVTQGLNVRQTEALVREGVAPVEQKIKSTGSTKSKSKANDNQSTSNKSSDAAALEATLTESMGMKVQLEEISENRGKIIVHYESLEDLDRAMQAMAGSGF